MFGDILSKAIVPPKPQSNLPHPVPRKRGLRRVRLFLAMKTTPIDQPNPEIIQFFTINKDQSRRKMVTIDASDDWILEMRWSACWSRGRFVLIQRSCSTGGDPVKSIHRILLRPEPLLCVDHIDRNPANNMRSNLRICTQSENTKNRSAMVNRTGFRGVSWNKLLRKWVSSIKCNGKTHYLGSFASPSDAHAAYCAAALSLHGEFAFNA